VIKLPVAALYVVGNETKKFMDLEHRRLLLEAGLPEDKKQQFREIFRPTQLLEERQLSRHLQERVTVLTNQVEETRERLDRLERERAENAQK
jgi:uncharacterized protein YlxW (UPF0749 family)